MYVIWSTELEIKMADPYTKIQNAHRPASHILTTKPFSLPRRGNSSSSIASALIKYNRNQLNHMDTVPSESLQNQPILKINKLYGGTRETGRPTTTSHAPRKLRSRNRAVSLSAECPSSPMSNGSSLSTYPVLQSHSQIFGETWRQPTVSMRQKGDIEIRLEIISNNWEIQETIIQLLHKQIIRDKIMYLKQLNTSKLFSGVKFKDLKQGSIILIANCVSLRNLSVLEEKYSSGKLEQILSQTFLTQRLYASVGYTGPALQMAVSIDEAKIELCKKGLQSLTKSLKLHGLDGGTFMSRTDCVKEVTRLTNKITAVEVTLNGDYNTFLNNLKDFFTVLKLTKPVEITTFDTLADVQRCYSYIKGSPSVGKELYNTETVQNFLQLVCYLENEVEHISQEFKQWEHLFSKYLDVKHLELFKCSVDHIKMLLHPEVEFSELDFSISMPLSVMERQLFAGLVKYMPALQTGVCDMANNMAVIKDHISLNTSAKPAKYHATQKPTKILTKDSSSTHHELIPISYSKNKVAIETYHDSVENRDTKTKDKSNIPTKHSYAAIIPYGADEEENFTQMEGDQDTTSGIEGSDLKSPSLTSETVEHQLKVNISYKQQPLALIPHQKHPPRSAPLLPRRRTRVTTEKTGTKEKPHFATRRKMTGEMARKLELALSQKRKFEYESVSNITNLLNK